LAPADLLVLACLSETLHVFVACAHQLLVYAQPLSDLLARASRSDLLALAVVELEQGQQGPPQDRVLEKMAQFDVAIGPWAPVVLGRMETLALSEVGSSHSGLARVLRAMKAQDDLGEAHLSCVAPWELPCHVVRWAMGHPWALACVLERMALHVGAGGPCHHPLQQETWATEHLQECLLVIRGLQCGPEQLEGSQGGGSLEGSN
jgi:hypothetical protein